MHLVFKKLAMIDCPEGPSSTRELVPSPTRLNEPQTETVNFCEINSLKYSIAGVDKRDEASEHKDTQHLFYIVF